MRRENAMAQMESRKEVWDFLVIGGGATGLGTAVDAAARGYRTLLVEQHDFAKGTSSRSTKLVHGGVRYLKQGNISLVLEALTERGRLVQNAPHLVHPLAFLIPRYSWWEGPFYGMGMKIYDRMAGKRGLNPSTSLSREETIRLIPTIEQEGLLGGVSYYDGQFDDARLAINLAQTIFDQGGVAINYMKVVRLLRRNDVICGACLQDEETGAEHEVYARVVINATGVFCDAIRKMDEPGAERVIVPSQGAHIVLPKVFLPGDTALMVPHTSDGRVLFAIPWHDHVVVGTTDVEVDTISLEPKAREEEIDFILTNAAKYLSARPERRDVLSVYAGLRPLVKTGDAKNSAALARDHTILVSRSGLVTITGGKWTTYRKMAQDVVDRAETVAGLEHRPCITANLQIHGGNIGTVPEETLRVYGSDASDIRTLVEQEPILGERLHPDLALIGAQVVWAVREEMARTVEDVLARRTRALILGATASIAVAPHVANLMARELGRNAAWEKQTVEDYQCVAQGYAC